jgi:hypothetical protein
MIEDEDKAKPDQRDEDPDEVNRRERPWLAPPPPRRPAFTSSEAKLARLQRKRGRRR